ncbi:MAG: lectin-like protein, partial [Akkermansiaceae bacterium]|nr:lectin-like protein [Akkermansiaceae bacterium]
YFIGATDEVVESVWTWLDGSVMSYSNWGGSEPNGDDYLAITTGGWGGIGFAQWNDTFLNPSDFNRGYILEFPKQTLTLTSPTHGSITSAGEYDPGTSATLTAIADAGYAFTGWTGDASGTTNPLTLTMDASKTVSATFAADLSDADSDGLTAYDEVTLYHTDPTKADSDNDGLSDAYELGIGRFSVISGTRTWAQAKAHAETQGGTLATFANQDEWNLAMQSIGSDALQDVGGLWIGATDEAVEGTWRWITGEPFVFTRWETGQPDNGSNSDYAAVAGDLGGNTGKWYDYRATTSRDGYILESGYSTNPSDADSDDDGLLDGAERTAGTNPFNADTDGDGLTDAQEVNLTHTNPKLADSNSNGTNDALDDQDSDGLTNIAEITQYGTDPINADTDHDGLTDLAELGRNRFVLVLPTSPLTFAQAVASARSKGGYLATFASQAEYEEALAQIPPHTLLNVAGLWIGASDEQTEGQWRWLTGEQFTFTKWALGEPNNTGNSDYAAIAGDLGGELGNWYDYRGVVTRDGYILEKSFITNPLLADTDGDGISDSQEIGLRTSPNVADTDGDGSSDGSESEFGGDPLSPSVSPQWKTNLQHQNSSSGFELRFPTRIGDVYQTEACSDLINWSVLETGIQGTGSTLSRTYASDGRAKRYFRVRRN